MLSVSFRHLAKIVSGGQIRASKCPTFHTRAVGYHNQIELTFAIKDTNKESIINDGGNRIATKMAVGK